MTSDAAPAEYLVCLGGGRAVRGLHDHFRLDPGRVLLGDLPLQRRRDEDVAIQLERISRRARLVAPGKSSRLAPLPPVGHHLLDVEALRVGDGALRLGEPDDHGPALLEELGGGVPDVAEALEHDPLSREPGGQAQRLHVLATLQISRTP